MEYLNQPGGSVGEVSRLEAIAAQMNVPIDTVAYLNFGDAVGTARFLFDPILQRTWLVPFSVPRDTIMETMINDQLNGKYTLTPCDLLVTHYHYSWQKHMAQGVWIRTKTDLVWCLEDGVWYRWVGDESKFPFITTNITSPRKSNDVVTPTNPLGNWEDMGITGLGATYKGDRGERGKSNYDLWLEAGNKGTFEDYQKTLIGPQGPQGIQGKDGKTGPQGVAGTEIKSIVGTSKELKDLPCPPTPPKYADNPNSLFRVEFTIDADNLVPGIPATGTIKVTDASTGKPTNLKADSLSVNITNGLGEVSTPIQTVGKVGEYTVELKGSSGKSVTFSVFISDIFMHGTSRNLKLIQLESAYRFLVYATPNLLEINGTPAQVTLEVTDYITRELADIPLSTLGLSVISGKGSLSEFTKVSTGKYTAKLSEHGEEGAIYLSATVNDIHMPSSTIVVNVVPEFQGKFWEAKIHANTKGYIGLNSWCFGGYASSNPNKPADMIVYINGRRAKYVESVGSNNATTWYYTTDNTSIADLNDVQVVGTNVLYWENNIAEITRIGDGVLVLDCANWRKTTGGLIPKFSCPLPKSINNLNNAFQGCQLESIDGIENWDVSHVTHFRACFAGMPSTSTVNYSSIRRTIDRTLVPSKFATKLNWDISNAVDISYIFAAGGSRNTDFLDITNMPKLVTALGLFLDCTSVNWQAELDWPLCTTISQMCGNTTDVVNVILDNSKLPSLVDMTSILGPVNSTTSVTSQNVTFSMKNINFKSLERVKYFTDKRGIASLDFSGSIFGEVTDISAMFGPNSNTTYTFPLKMVNTKFPKVINATQVFMNFNRIMQSDLNGLEMPVLQNAYNMFTNCSNMNLSDLSKIVTKNLVTATGMFYGCRSFNTKLNHCDVSSIVDSASMFALCSSLDQPLTGMKFSSLATANAMFTQCSSFNSKIDAEFPVLSGVTEMFKGCVLFNQDIAPLFKSGTVKVANSTFKGCTVFNYTLANCDFSKLTDATSMFDGCSSFNQVLETISFPVLTTATGMFTNCSSFNQSVVKLNMPLLMQGASMFDGCTSLSVPLKGFTLPSLTNASRMFNNCPSLNKDCTNMRLPEVTTLERFFGNSPAAPLIIDLTGSQFNKARNVLSMFYGATPLVANFTNVEFNSLNDGSKMFYGVPSDKVTLIMKGAKFPSMTVGDNMFQDMSSMNDAFENVDFSALVSAISMFHGCTAFNPTFKDTKFGSLAMAEKMFAECSSFNANIAPLFAATLSNASNMLLRCSSFNQPLNGEWKELTVAPGMLDSCTAFNQPLSGTVFSKLTNSQGMFKGCSSFNKPIPATTFPALSVSNNMFESCISFNSAIELNFENITRTDSMFKNCQAFNQPLNYNLIGVLDASGMFQNCTKLNQPITELKLPAALNIASMFMGCSSFDQPVSGFTAPVATDASQLFANCTLLNQEITNLVLPNVTNAKAMFSGCSSLSKGINLTLNSVTTIASMFERCIGLTTATIKINSTGCTNATDLFRGCGLLNGAVTLTMPNLRTLEQAFYQCSSFNSKVTVSSNNLTTVSRMFANCAAFNTSLNDLDVSKVTTFTEMFIGCSAYNQPMDKWNVSSATPNSSAGNSNTSMAAMFRGCTSLVQNISMWNVKSQTVKPNNFDTETSSSWTTSMKPQWGK